MIIGWIGCFIDTVCVCVGVQEALEKQTQHAQELSEKLWLAERNLEEIEIEKDTKGKKAVELNSTVDRLETEVHMRAHTHTHTHTCTESDACNL